MCRPVRSGIVPGEPLSGRRLATWPGGSGHATAPFAVYDPTDPGRDRSGGLGPGLPSGPAAVGLLPRTSRISSAGGATLVREVFGGGAVHRRLLGDPRGRHRGLGEGLRRQDARPGRLPCRDGPRLRTSLVANERAARPLATPESDLLYPERLEKVCLRDSSKNEPEI